MQGIILTALSHNIVKLIFNAYIVCMFVCPIVKHREVQPLINPCFHFSFFSQLVLQVNWSFNQHNPEPSHVEHLQLSPVHLTLLPPPLGGLPGAHRAPCPGHRIPHHHLPAPPLQRSPQWCRGQWKRQSKKIYLSVMRSRILMMCHYNLTPSTR